MFVAEQAADEHRRRHGVERHSNALAFEVFRILDVLAVDEDEAVPENKLREYGNGDVRALISSDPRYEFRDRDLGGVVGLILGHAIEDQARIVLDNELEIEALDRNLAGIERQHAIVETARKRQ